MSDVIIRATDLRKVYRLYSGLGYRFLDMIGLLRSAKNVYTEHAALDGITLEIHRGERVAIIGRNGAGKSTLLKLVSKVTEPTSGTIEVNGRARALLQIGVGFYPDFTGRENVLGYLAHLGVTGKAAEKQLQEIVEFAELEEYVNQPIKTYSTGMAVRLMFATSTAIFPDILVLDEVLSVGDAYFAHKSFERMRELSRQQATTVLLVTHDIYSASKLCERMIWLDQGRIMFDGTGASAIRAYEDSIRAQEERRMRTVKQSRLAEIAGRKHLIVEVRSRNNVPQDSPVYFSRVALLHQGNAVAELPISTDFDVESTCWGQPSLWQNRIARPMLNYGSPFHKVGGVLALPGGLASARLTDMELALDYWSDADINLEVCLYEQGRGLNLGSVPSFPGRWAHQTFPLGTAVDLAAGLDFSTTGIHGSAAIAVTDVCIFNHRQVQSYVLSHGQPAEVHILFEVRNPELDEKAQVLIAIHKDGVQDVCRFITRALHFDRIMSKGTIRLRIPALRIADGSYTLTVMIAAEGYYDRRQTLFYSINPGVYACLPRVLEFQVVDGGAVAAGTVVVDEGEWSFADEGNSAMERHGIIGGGWGPQ